MSAGWLWARRDLRRRWRSVALLAILTALAAVAVVIGVPVGIAAGHLVWWAVASSVPVAYVAPGVVLGAGLVIPGALVVAIAAAVWPGRRAARMSPAAVLRAE